MEWTVAYEVSRPYQIYNFTVVKHTGQTRLSTWNVSKRYSEFRELHHDLESRFQSPNLSKFYAQLGFEGKISMPEIPPREGELFSHSEINVRKQGLEKFLKELFVMPYISESISFKKFLNEPADEMKIKK